MLKYILLLAAAICIIAQPAPTTYTYKTVGQLNIQADVYVPAQSSSSQYPVVLAIHGGGYVMGSKQGAFTGYELNEMLSRGWCVVSIDYRLGPDAFLWETVEDVQDAYNWIRTELVKNVTINTTSILVWGQSAGGGLAVISGYMLNPRPQAIISLYPGCTNYTQPFNYNPETPVGDILVTEANALRQPLAEYNTLPTNDPREALFNTATQEQKLGWILTSRNQNEAYEIILSLLREFSVVYQIDSDYPPTSLLHGLNDTLVPCEESISMAGYLKEYNVPYQLGIVPDVGHGFDGSVTNTSTIWTEFILPAFDFGQKYIGGISSEEEITVSSF